MTPTEAQARATTHICDSILSGYLRRAEQRAREVIAQQDAEEDARFEREMEAGR